ncbi:M14 family metallopeptidase [Thermodesulfobacteriota bacterium]
MIKVGSASAEKGQKGHGFLKVGELSVHSEIQIPVLIVNGKEEGPTLWVAGAVHGFEIEGFLATRRVAFNLDPNKLKGCLICTPLCNPLATQWRQKRSPYDFLDMDQEFPGKPDGSYSQRVAHILFQEIKEKANYTLIFHSARPTSMLEPYTVYKTVAGVSPEITSEVERFAKAFGLIVNSKVDLSTAKGELPGSMRGALDVNCVLHGIPAFMAEIGRAQMFEEKHTSAGERGLYNLLKYLNMIPGEIDYPKKQIIITKRRFASANKAGFLIMDAKPATIVRKGHRIAHIIDLFSELEVMEAEEDSFIIVGSGEAIVHIGDVVAVIGSEWGENL